jgi:hypothetical protein
MSASSSVVERALHATKLSDSSGEGVKTMQSRAIVVGVAIAALISAASADTIVFDTYTANHGHDMYTGYTIGGTSYAQPLGTQQAIPFQPTQSGYFSEIYSSIRLSTAMSAGVNEVKFSIMSDAGFFPGTILEDITIVDQMATVNTGAPVHGIATGTTWLDSTQTYWLLARAPETTPATFLQWYYNNRSPVLTNNCYWRAGDVGTWALRTAIPAPAVSISVVPEPASLSLLGLAGLLGMPRRR